MVRCALPSGSRDGFVPKFAEPPNKGVALDRAGMTVFQDITFLAAGPAIERNRSAGRCERSHFPFSLDRERRDREDRASGVRTSWNATAWRAWHDRIRKAHHQALDPNYGRNRCHARETSPTR